MSLATPSLCQPFLFLFIVLVPLVQCNIVAIYAGDILYIFAENACCSYGTRYHGTHAYPTWNVHVIVLLSMQTAIALHLLDRLTDALQKLE